MASPNILMRKFKYALALARLRRSSSDPKRLMSLPVFHFREELTSSA
jgi:hypothetical protein